VFADEHSLSFSWSSKKMSSVSVLIEKKSKCFREEKKSKCPKKNFQSVKKGGEKKYKCGISGVRKKKN